VTGTRTREPITASTTLVTARDLDGVPRRSAEDALRLVPGVTLVQQGSEGKGMQFLVRGFDAGHGADFEITVEGMPVNEWSNVHAQGYVDLGFVIPELISSVRVTKGPFTLQQGAFAMAGSADYHLGLAAEDRGLRAAYTTSTTSRHRGLITYSPRDGNGHDFIASETIHDAGFGKRRGVDKGTVLGKTELLQSEQYGRLSLLGAAYVARFQLPGMIRDDDWQGGRVDFRDAYTDTSRGASLRALSALTYEHDFEHGQLRALAYAGARRLEVFENFTGYLFDRQRGDFRLQQQDGLNLGLQLRLSRELWHGAEAHVGAGMSADMLDQQQLHTDAAEKPILRERDLDAGQVLTHALAGVTLTPHRRVRLDSGIRLDVAHVEAKDRAAGDARGGGTLAAVSPRAVVEWHALQALRLFAAYGRGLRPPEARAFSQFRPSALGISEETFDGGEPAITTTDSLELGVRFRPHRQFTSQLSGFATFIGRESVYDHVSGLNVELNGTRRLGGELSVKVAPSDTLELKADATALDARFNDSGNAVPLAPTLFGSARVTWGGDHGLRGGARFLAIAPRQLPHGAHSSTFTQLDATAGYWWPNLRLELEVENLLNQREREGEYHFASYWPGAAPASSIPSLHYVAGPPLNARLTLTSLF
jgi:outer membrane receptor protein involved in Fe transport